jgi:polyisoprenoid-binding protein YceI
MKIFFLLTLLVPFSLSAQKLLSSESKVVFFSDAAIEDITASNTRSNGIIDLSRNAFAFSVPIKDFQFEKSLMKEHFNEKYMETEKFPKATFTGNIQNFDLKAEDQKVVAKGKLSIHGVTKDVEIPSELKKTKDGFEVHAKFMVQLADYDIKIPQLLFQNIAESVEVTVDFKFKPE